MYIASFVLYYASVAICTYFIMHIAIQPGLTSILNKLNHKSQGVCEENKKKN